MGKSVRSFVGSELSFLKLVSVLVGLSGGVSNKASTAKITAFEVKCVFWLVDWNWSGPRTNPYIKFLLDLCVC